MLIGYYDGARARNEFQGEVKRFSFGFIGRNNPRTTSVLSSVIITLTSRAAVFPHRAFCIPARLAFPLSLLHAALNPPACLAPLLSRPLVPTSTYFLLIKSGLGLLRRFSTESSVFKFATFRLKDACSHPILNVDREVPPRLGFCVSIFFPFALLDNLNVLLFVQVHVYFSRFTIWSPFFHPNFKFGPDHILLKWGQFFWINCSVYCAQRFGSNSSIEILRIDSSTKP